MAPGATGDSSPRYGAVVAYVALGGNLGDVLAAFRGALAAMPGSGLDVLAVSSAYRTEALLPAGASLPSPDYWNAVCRVSTRLSPEAVLGALQVIETRFGRVRRERWAARTLDLDLLLYDDACVRTATLEVPHPALTERVFVLRPLCELAPGQVVPGRGVTVAEALERLDASAGVREIIRDWRP
jgi:2-amino-4-hydroxy-6-hydroxymethyldihydropteridine diphosphokinase